MCDGNVDRLTIFEGKTNVTTMSKLRKENQARALRTEELSKFKIVRYSFHIFQPSLPDGLPRLELPHAGQEIIRRFSLKLDVEVKLIIIVQHKTA